MPTYAGGRGSYNATCDVCGFQFKASELKLRWDGFWCCPEDWESRNPQDFIKTIKDATKLPFTRPEPTDVFITVCTMEGRHAYANFGTADCMQAGFTLYTPTQLLELYVCSIEGHLPFSGTAEADCAEVI